MYVIILCVHFFSWHVHVHTYDCTLSLSHMFICLHLIVKKNCSINSIQKYLSCLWNSVFAFASLLMFFDSRITRNNKVGTMVLPMEFIN